MMVEGWLVSQRHYTPRLLILHRTGLPTWYRHSYPVWVPRLFQLVFVKRRANIAHLHKKTLLFTVQITWNI
jgi:hypothetical protein